MSENISEPALRYDNDWNTKTIVDGQGTFDVAGERGCDKERLDRFQK